MPNCAVSVVDECGVAVPPGAVGELVVRGPNVMQGYWGDPALTARVFRPLPGSGERALYTGDLFKQDADGFLYFIGRRDDLIKTRGERVSPREVENAICQLPGVAECAVLAVPDDVLGQAVKAVVVPAPGAHLTERDVQRHCASRLEPLLIPKYAVLLDELPRTANGKIDRQRLRTMEAPVP